MQAAEKNPGPDNSETSSVKSKTKKDQTGPKKEKEVKEFLAMEQSSDVAIGRVMAEKAKNPMAGLGLVTCWPPTRTIALRF